MDNQTELSTSLRIGCYPAWIIVSYSRYKPWPNPGKRVLFQTTPNKLNKIHRLKNYFI
jgi:hypothetical protein